MKYLKKFNEDYDGSLKDLTYDSIISDTGLTIKQEYDLEQYLYNEMDIYEYSKEELIEMFKPGSESFANLLNTFDMAFDWFDYRLATNIISFLKSVIEDEFG